MIKVSVIIPVYNAQRFIRRCLDSILGQEFSDFEVICIDDGSTDESFKILSEYSLRYDNVKVVQQQNAGQGPARNKGVALARGEYIKFVDADDYLHLASLQILYGIAKKTNAEIVVCKAFCVDATGNIVSPLKIWNNLFGNYSKNEFINIDFFNNACSPVLWDKLIKTNIAKRSLSPSLRRGQDFVTLIKYLSLCNNVFFINDRLYYYRHHDSSVMSTIESRETIMSDFATEQMALDVMSDFFRDTKSYRFYCHRIKYEWAERIKRNKILLTKIDTTLIEDYLSKLDSV